MWLCNIIWHWLYYVANCGETWLGIVDYIIIKCDTIVDKNELEPNVQIHTKNFGAKGVSRWSSIANVMSLKLELDKICINIKMTMGIRWTQASKGLTYK